MSWAELWLRSPTHWIETQHTGWYYPWSPASWARRAAGVTNTPKMSHWISEINAKMLLFFFWCLLSLFNWLAWFCPFKLRQFHTSHRRSYLLISYSEQVFRVRSGSESTKNCFPISQWEGISPVTQLCTGATHSPLLLLYIYIYFSFLYLLPKYSAPLPESRHLQP